MILNTKISSLLLGTTGALALTAAAQTPLFQYDNPMTAAGGSPVVGTGTVGAAGTALGTGTTLDTTAQQGTDDNKSYGLNDGAGGGSSLGTGWTTNATFASLTNGAGEFTAFALVTPADNNNDNIIFGTDGAGGQNYLHLGFRGGNVQFGFWGNDTTRGTAVAPGTTAVIAFRYTATGGLQDAFINGTNVLSNGGHTAFANTGSNVVIGTTGGNGGDLNGSLDDVQWYNSALTDAQVSTISSNIAAADVPEPATVAALIGGAGMLLGLRRRRS